MPNHRMYITDGSSVGSMASRPSELADRMGSLSNVARSKAFYQRLTGLPIQAEDKDFCEFRLEGGFLGIYAPDAGQQPGFNHFCFGVDAYNPQAALTALNVAAPEAKPALENQDQVYVQDPDGVRVQFADVRYKR